MATTPPPEEQPTRQPGSSYTLNMTDMARLPIPGNAEFGVFLVALILAWLVCWFSDSLNASSWLNFFLWTTAAYLISRGVAKASRVLEQ
jgi:uncharacterized protein (DUF983 family)